ncbi:MAG: glycerol-3-phosphate dehydrogenase/oxidase [Bacteroidales bacterium]|nr:glycerol-3-phosphate dehydrogenase/oxidase [Bacteroidales bacterium]MCF8456281.1 glycerol-3-phosphate dehydrogenase/oxidase [Bacteroidales bacterium]
MDRKNMIADLKNTTTHWDIAIIGGGATGVGTAVEAASRGYKIILIEQSDFGKATSSRSTKLVHGGVRYLQQGNITLVLEALKERGIMRRNAPHLVHDLPFIVPVYDWWEGPFYGIGLKIYDMMAGKEGFGPSKILSKEETLELIPTIETEGLKGGVIYHDGQFDDARLLINLMQTATEQGATMLNYVKALSLIHENNILTGILAEDQETGEKHSIRAKVIINATGVFADSIRKMDDAGAPEIMTSSQGVHLVLDKSFLPGSTAIMVPHTDDGRVLFAVPWHDRTLVGTTDTFVKEYPLEPTAHEDEIAFLLKHAAIYLTKDPQRSDVKSVFVGLRPLVKNATNETDTASISRDHTITISRTGLISISGGKWTTYRKMAEDVIEQAILLGDLPESDSVSKTLQIHGYHNNSKNYGPLSWYGSDANALEDLINENEENKKLLHADHSIRQGEIIWAVRNEMGRTVEDFLARRTRLLLLDARASMEAAPVVAKIMAKELGRDEEWEKNQIREYTQVATNYLLD